MREWLRVIRESKQLSQTEVARRAGITAAYYCMIESGKKTPKSGVAMRIADVLGFYWARFYEEKAG